MKIIVFSNRGNIGQNKAEERIDDALENLGYKVIKINENESMSKILEYDADVLLFFKAGSESGRELAEIEKNLKAFKGHKICIHWDKIWGGRQNYIQSIAPLTDLIFLSDGDFVRSNNYLNVYELPQATCVEKSKSCGKEKEEYKIPIVFPGNIYGGREEFAKGLLSRYGSMFKVVINVFDDNLTDLCESAKIIVSPAYPQADFYWSNRVYQIIGRGGFLIMPRLEGLTKEFKEGKHIEFYRSPNELFSKIDYYLEHEDERNRIRKAGQKYCLENYTYEKTLKKMLSLL